MTETQKTEEISQNNCFVFFGLDVSKLTFTASCFNGVDRTVHFPNGTQSFEINRKGVRAFLKWRKQMLNNQLVTMGLEDVVVMETTGHYSVRLATLLKKEDDKLRIAICNACSISHYIKSHRIDKTDRQDAEYIARYGFDAQPKEWKELDKSQKYLRRLIKQRDSLVEERTRFLNQKDSIEPEFEDILIMNKQVIDLLNEQIRTIEDKLKESVLADEDAKKEIEIMTSLPGIGTLSAAIIYATFGSLKNYTRNELSSLSGICPANRQSGTSVNSTRISRHGSAYLRKILFLCSIQAERLVPALTALRDRLLARSHSSKMTARCACMRKILIILRGMVVSGKKYDPNYGSSKKTSEAQKCGLSA